MRNQRLAELNFRQLVDYGGQPAVEHSYDPPLTCTDYCVQCESRGLLDRSGRVLDLMSHACDSSDFEALLGPLPLRGHARLDSPVMFLLQDPGADCGNGEEVPVGVFRKKPPVRHYYWTPEGPEWPSSPTQLNGNYYGAYFAYLMREHGLGNVYITNVLKCRITKVSEPRDPSWTETPVVQQCITNYLLKELAEHEPVLVFCFGRKVHRIAASVSARLGDLWHAEYLAHPAFIAHRTQTQGKTSSQVVLENDDRVRKALQKTGLRGSAA